MQCIFLQGEQLPDDPVLVPHIFYTFGNIAFGWLFGVQYATCLMNFFRNFRAFLPLAERGQRSVFLLKRGFSLGTNFLKSWLVSRIVIPPQPAQHYTTLAPSLDTITTDAYVRMALRRVFSSLNEVVGTFIGSPNFCGSWILKSLKLRLEPTSYNYHSCTIRELFKGRN